MTYIESDEKYYLDLEAEVAAWEIGGCQDAAEQVRDLMDILWYKLSDENRDSLNNRELLKRKTNND